MNIVATRKRLAVALSALCLCAIVVLNFIPTTEAETSPAIAPTITVANAVDDVQGGPNDDGNADPGDTLEYTVTINNTAAPGAGNDGTNVVMSDTLSNILTLVPGSLVASPVVANDSYTGSGNIPLAPATSVLANDIDPLIGNNTGVTVTKVQGTGANVGVATNTTAVGRGGVTGSVIVAADGTLTYEPPPGFVGADTFTYNASKNGQESAATTVTITISNMVWFISNNAGGLNRGTFSNPFTSIAAFNTANAGTGVMPDPKSGDLIALRTGTGTYTEADGINLRAQQKVIGNAVQFSTVFTADAGSSSAYATFAGAVAGAPSIVTTAGNGVDLSTDNTVRGLNVGNTPGFFKMNGGAVGAPIVNTVNLTGTGGAMNISTSGAFGSTVSFGTLESTSSPAANLNLVGVTGSITIASPGTGLSGSAAASAVVNVSGGSVGFTYTGNVTKSAGTGALVSVSGGHNGTVTFSTGTLSATAGTGFQFDNADGTYTFSGTNTMNGGDAGIDVLNGSSGTFNFSAASTIASPTGTAFNVSTGNPTVSFLGTITDNTTAQRAVNIDGTTGGAISITTVTAGSIAGGVGNTGININNANGSVTFTTLNLGTSGTRMTAQPVTIAGGSGAKSLGTVNIFTTGAAQGIVSTTTTGAITIATGNINSAGAAAVNIAGTSAASLTPINIQLVSVNANGGANGILVSNTSSTGSPGGFRVFGTGTTDASGGTIQNTTDRGASFITAANIILNNMAFTNAGTTDLDATNGGLSTGDNLATNAAINLVTVATATLTNVDITGGAEQGINGNSVSAFSLINSTITNAGNEADEDNIHFYNMSGTSVITNTVLAHADGDDNINLQTQSGNLTLTISGGSASGSALHEGSGYLFGIRGTTSATINFNNSSGSGVTSTNNFSGGLVADVFDSATVALNVSNFTSSNNNDQISVSAGDNSNVDLNISNSTFTSTTAADFVGIGLLGSAFDTGYTFDVRILNNTINIANGLTADAMVINNAGGGLINAVVSNNTINYSGTQRAILIQGGQDGVAKSNMTVTGNTININLDGTGNAATGILAQVAVATPAPPSPGSANSFLCLDAGGGVAGLRNTFVHPLAGTMPAGDIRVRQRFDSEIRLPGYAGAANDNTAVVNYLAARNTLVNVPTATATNDIGVDPGATGFVNAGASCAQPNPVAQNGEYRLEDSNGARDLSLSMPLFSSYPASFVNMAAMERAVRAERAIRDAQLAPISGFEIEKTEEPLAPAMGAEIAADLQETESGPSSTMEVVTRLFEVISPTVHAQEERIGKAESAAPQSGETVTVNGAGTGFTLPAGKSVTIKFRATVENGPYASGLNNVDNTANVTANAGTVNVNSNISSFALDAAPDLQMTVGDANTTTQPGGVLQYTTTYQNNTAINGQHAGAVRVSQTVPINTTFNATVSGAGWSCPDGSPATTVCTFDVGAVNAGAAPGSLTFAVNVLTLLPSGAVNIGDTATIAENPLNANGNDRVPANNTSSDTTNIVGNWDGSNSADWNLAQNWSNDVLPPAGNSISIPLAGNQPQVISADVTVNLLSLGRNLSIGSGRTVSASGNVALGTNFIDGLGTLSLGTASAITHGAGGQVNATLRKNFAAPGPVFEMPVGTTGAFSPLNVTVTNGAGQLTVKANTGVPAILAPNTARTLQRYWTLSGSGIRSNITFNYLNADVPPAPNNENIWNVIRVNGTTAVRFAPSADIILNAASNTFTVNNLESYSDWTAGEPLAPTAASANIVGRVLDGAGRGVSGALVSMQSQEGNVVWATTNPFGYYRFVSVQVGHAYLVSPQHKRFVFAPRTINLSDDVTGLDFTPER